MKASWRIAMLLSLSCAGEGASDAGTHAVPAGLAACAAQQRTLGSLEALIEHLNGLPHPVSVACAVASFERPLDLVATNSVISAQPADGNKNPRIFILEPAMALSVVPHGPGSELLELGAWVTPLRTLKGEFAFPLEQPLEVNAPLSRVMYNASMTNCALCHRDETRHTALDAGFVSAAYRPAPETLVPWSALAAEHTACVSSGESSERCDLFHAIFDFGLTRPAAFDPSVEVFVR